MASFSATLLYHLPRATAAAPPPRPASGRRQCLLLLPITASPALLLAARPPSAKAEDIPLFGLRKRLKKIEEEAVEVVKEGEKVLEEGIIAGEKEIQAAGEEITEGASGFEVAGDLIQAVGVAGAEAVGVLVGVSIVNNILGPERQSP